MQIDLSPLQYTFLDKPLVVGGRAKEYYDVRKSGEDIDLIITSRDYDNLAQKYPDNLADLVGDLGIKVHGFEIWKTICLFGYAELSVGAIDCGDYLMISLEKLVFLTALGMHKPKYYKDLELIIKKIFEIKYKGSVPPKS